MFSGSIFHMKRLPVMLNHPLYHIYGYSYSTPIHISHNVFVKVVHTSSFSSSSSMTGSFFILSQLPSWQCPHALVHSSPCLLQVHLRVLHPSKQLQWIIWGRTFVCHHWNKFVPFYLPSPLRWCHFITTSHPLHSLVVSPQRMKSTGRGGWRELFWRDEHLCPCNFLSEHIVCNRRQWVLLISIEQCYHCLRTIVFHNILRLLWSREYSWTVFHCLFSFDDSLEPRLLSLDTESHPVKAFRSNRSLQTAAPSTCLRTLIL